MQSLIRSKSAGVTGGRGTAGAGPGRDLLYYSTYDQELLAGMLVLSSQSRLLGSNPIV